LVSISHTINGNAYYKSGNPDVSMMDVPEVAQYDDDDSDASQGAAEVSAILDPKALPKSMGLSFVVVNGSVE
jgi:hypothetical protein